MKRRRRIITRVIVFLLLGAIVNVAVAWGCAAWMVEVEPGGELSISQDAIPAWLVVLKVRPARRTLHLQSLGTEQFIQMFRRVHGLSAPSVIAMIPAERRQVPAGCYQQCSFRRDWSGWPLYCMACDTEGTWDAFNRVIVQTVVSSGIELNPVDPSKTKGIRNRALPLRPIYPGFAINTIFYAGVLWMVFAFPFVVRRRRRIRRGLCPACAYPVGTSPVCTECGLSLAQHSSLRTLLTGTAPTR